MTSEPSVIPSIGFGLERVGLIGARRPWLALAICVVLTAASLLGLSRLGFDGNVGEVIRSDNAVWRAYERFPRDFEGVERDLFVLVEAPDIADPATFEALRNLHFEAQFADGVAAVTSPFSIRRPGGAGGAEGGAPVLDSAETRPDIETALRELAEAAPGGIAFATADRTAVLFVVARARGAGVPPAGALAAALGSLAAERLAGTGATAAVTGVPLLQQAIVGEIKRDALTLNLVGSALGFLASWLILGSAAAAVITALPAILAAVWVVGTMGLAGTPLNVMTTVIPVLVLVLGYANAVHMSHGWRRRRLAGDDAGTAGAAVALEVGPACMLSGLTTALAFASFAFASTYTVREFGIVGASATVATMLAVALVHPMLAHAFGRWWTLRHGKAGDRLALERLSGGLVRRAAAWRWMLPAGLALSLGLAAIYAQVETRYSISEHLAQDHPVNAALLRVDQRFGGALPVHAVVPLGDGGLDDEGLARVRAVHEAVARLSPGVLSPWTLAGFAATPDAAGVAAVLEALPEPQRHRLLSRDGRSALLTVPVTERPTGEQIAFADRLEAAARAAAPELADAMRVTGMSVTFARESRRIIESLNLSLLAAIVASIAMVAVAFRSLGAGLVAFPPNLLPVLATGAFLSATGQGLQFASMLALTIAFGIAVDDTVHFLNRWRLERLRLGAAGPAMDAAAGRAGPAIVASSLILMLGTGVTALSALPMVQLFGMLSILLLFVAMVADLTVLPALLARVPERWLLPASASSRS